MSKNNKLLNYSPYVIALLSFCVMCFIIMNYSEFNRDQKEKEARSKLMDILIAKKSRIEKALYSRIYYTKGIAAFVSINPNISNDTYHNLANELINSDSVINTMALSKNCIIGAVYPIKGHESAIGLNLLEHPERKKIVDTTIKTKNTFIAGPVTLIEGGVAFISYTPIFIKSQDSSQKFWGMTDIVILKEQLFNEIKLFSKDENYSFALRGIDGNINNRECFWGDNNVFYGSPVSIEILLPTGSWILGGIPIVGWKNHIENSTLFIAVLYFISFIVSFLIGLLSKFVLMIRSNERELKAIFRSMQDLIIEYNAAGDYIKIAPTNENLLFKPKEELLGKNISDFFEKNTADYFLNAIKECIDTKSLVLLDYPLVIKSETIWFHARISYISDDAVIFLINDNTRKKAIEDMLIKSEEKFRFLTENSADIIWQLDENLIFTYVSLADERIRGFKQSEVIGSSFWSCLKPESRKLFMIDNSKFSSLNYKNFKKTLDNNQFQLVCKDESVKWCEINSIPIFDDKGELIGFNGVTRDISERIKLLNELKQLNKTKDMFFSILAHDLKNPISSFNQIIKYVADDNGELSKNEKKKFLDELQESSKSIYELLENLLTWSHSQSGKIEFHPVELDLKFIVSQTFSLLRLSANNKKITLFDDVNPKLFVFADASMVNTIIRNLISNSIKFSNDGGMITVSTSLNPKNSGQVLVSIQDTGIGIPEENIEKIFRIDTAFTTVGTSDEKGTGLGLILCKEFVERNNGTIWVESEVGIGSTFYFTLVLNSHVSGNI